MWGITMTIKLIKNLLLLSMLLGMPMPAFGMGPESMTEAELRVHNNGAALFGFVAKNTVEASKKKKAKEAKIKKDESEAKAKRIAKQKKKEDKLVQDEKDEKIAAEKKVKYDKIKADALWWAKREGLPAAGAVIAYGFGSISSQFFTNRALNYLENLFNSGKAHRHIKREFSWVIPRLGDVKGSAIKKMRDDVKEKDYELASTYVQEARESVSKKRQGAIVGVFNNTHQVACISGHTVSNIFQALLEPAVRDTK